MYNMLYPKNIANNKNNNGSYLPAMTGKFSKK